MTTTDQADSAAFAPVPLRARHDGWTLTRQRQFVEALTETGSVTAAARSVGMTAQSAYRLRRRDSARDFAAAWDAALEMGRAPLLDVAFDRAVNGVAMPIFYKGEQVGERRTYNDRLLMFLLRNHVEPSTPASQRDFLASDWEAALDRLERGQPVLPQPGSPGGLAMLFAEELEEEFRPVQTGDALVDWFTGRGEDPPDRCYDEVVRLAFGRDEARDEDLPDGDEAHEAAAAAGQGDEAPPGERQACAPGGAGRREVEPKAVPAPGASAIEPPPPPPAALPACEAPPPPPRPAPGSAPAASPPPPATDPTMRRIAVPLRPRWRPDLPPPYAQPL